MTVLEIPSPVTACFEGAKVWVGCLNCYNNADLVGEWFDACEAADVTLDVLHLEHPLQEGCEEMWCFDVDGMPVNEEMDPLTAARWGNLLSFIDEKLQPSFFAWIEAGAVSYGSDGMPDPQAFEEAFIDVFTDFREYADRLADETLLFDVSEEVRRYFDYESFARDLAMDHIVETLPDGNIVVFHA